MADPYPLYSEFTTHSPYCNGSAQGCMVAATAVVLTRYKKTIPMEGSLPNLKKLGSTMGALHRAADDRVRHGFCPNAWCGYCAYLQLKSQGVAAAYGSLTLEQFRAHAKAKRPMIVSGLYGKIRIVAEASYSKTIPAKGRSDRFFLGAHAITVWGVGSTHADGTPKTYICSDADFGSSARPVLPPHCEFFAADMEAFWLAFQWGVCYMIQTPPALTDPIPVPALPYGAGKFSRGQYKVKVDGTNLRKSPFVKSDNVIKQLAQGTTFACAMSTYAGTNVGGSTLWHGTADGKKWVHHSVVYSVGHTTGKETIK